MRVSILNVVTTLLSVGIIATVATLRMYRSARIQETRLDLCERWNGTSELRLDAAAIGFDFASVVRSWDPKHGGFLNTGPMLSSPNWDHYCNPNRTSDLVAHEDLLYELVHATLAEFGSAADRQVISVIHWLHADPEKLRRFRLAVQMAELGMLDAVPCTRELHFELQGLATCAYLDLTLPQNAEICRLRHRFVRLVLDRIDPDSLCDRLSSSSPSWVAPRSPSSVLPYLLILEPHADPELGRLLDTLAKRSPDYLDRTGWMTTAGVSADAYYLLDHVLSANPARLEWVNRLTHGAYFTAERAVWFAEKLRFWARMDPGAADVVARARALALFRPNKTSTPLVAAALGLALGEDEYRSAHVLAAAVKFIEATGHMLADVHVVPNSSGLARFTVPKTADLETSPHGLRHWFWISPRTYGGMGKPEKVHLHYDERALDYTPILWSTKGFPSCKIHGGKPLDPNMFARWLSVGNHPVFSSVFFAVQCEAGAVRMWIE